MHDRVESVRYKWNYPAIENWVPGIGPQSDKGAEPTDSVGSLLVNLAASL